MAIRLLLPFVLILAVWVVVARPAGRGPVAKEWRDVLFVRVAAFVVGIVITAAAIQELELGRGLVLAPAIMGAAVVAGVTLGETVGRPARSDGWRVAGRQPYRVRDHVSTRRALAVSAVVLAHLATLTLTTVTASADDMGRAGRVVAYQCAEVAAFRSPYPGSFYSVPLIAVLVVAGAIAATGLAVAVRRPRGLVPGDVGGDGLRRRSVRAIVSALGVAVAASQTGVALAAGIALVGMDSCAAGWMRPAGIVLLASVPAAVVAAAWFLGRVVVPERLR